MFKIHNVKPQLKLKRLFDKEFRAEYEKLDSFPSFVISEYIEKKNSELEAFLQDAISFQGNSTLRMEKFDFNLEIFGITIDLLKTKFVEEFIRNYKSTANDGEHQKMLYDLYFITLMRRKGMIARENNEEENKIEPENGEINYDRNIYNFFEESVVIYLELYIKEKFGVMRGKEESPIFEISDWTIFPSDFFEKKIIEKRKNSIEKFISIINSLRNQFSLPFKQKHKILFGAIISMFESLQTARKAGFKSLKETAKPSLFVKKLEEIMSDHIRCFNFSENEKIEYKKDAKAIYRSYEKQMEVSPTTKLARMPK